MLIGMNLLIALVFAGCLEESINSNQEINSIVISFSGNPVDNYSYKLTEKENIIEAMRIYQDLKTYKSPKITTWFEDVTFEIEAHDGRTQTRTFKKIRPVNDIFKEIFNSLEVREQAVPVIMVNHTDVEKLTVYSPKTGKMIVFDEENHIEKILLSLQNYYRSDAVTNNEHLYSVAELEIYDKSGSNSGLGQLFREDKNTIEAIKNLGEIEDIIIRPSDIDTMTLTHDDKTIEISEESIMQIVLDNYVGFHSRASVISVEYHLKEAKGNRLDWHGSFLKDQIPNEIEGLFK